MTILALAVTGSIVGFVLGLLRRSNPDLSSWQGFATGRGILDLPAFVRVAYIHNASYLGTLVGLIAAVFGLQRLRRRGEPAAQPQRTA